MNKINIVVDLKTNTASINSLNAQVDTLNKSTAKSTSLANNLYTKLRSLAAISLAGLGVGKVASSLVGVNAQMQNLTNSLTILNAATSSSISSTGRLLNVQEKYALATKEAGLTLKDLLVLNAKTPHTLNETAQIYKAMFVSMRKIGASSKDILEVTEKLSVASAGAGIAFNQLLAGADGLASGMVLPNSELGRFLNSINLTNEAIKQSSAPLDLIKSKLSGFESLPSFDIEVSKLKNSIDLIKLELSSNAFTGLENTLRGINKSLSETDLSALANNLKNAGLSAGALGAAFLLYKNVNLAALASSARGLSVALKSGALGAKALLRAIPFVAIGAGVFEFLSFLDKAKEKTDLLNKSLEELSKLSKAQIPHAINTLRAEIGNLGDEINRARPTRDWLGRAPSKKDLEAFGYIEAELKAKQKAIVEKIKALQELQNAKPKQEPKEALKPTFDISSYQRSIDEILRPQELEIQAVKDKWAKIIKDLKANNQNITEAVRARETEIRNIKAKGAKDEIKETLDIHAKALELDLEYYTKKGDLANAWNAKRQILDESYKGFADSDALLSKYNAEYEALKAKIEQPLEINVRLSGMDMLTGSLAELGNAYMDYKTAMSSGADLKSVAKAQNALYKGAMTATSSLFDASSKKAQNLAKVQRAVSLAQMALDLASFNAKMAQESTKQAAAGTTALASSLQAPPPLNIASYISVAGLLASLGIALGASGNTSTSTDALSAQKANTGTGTVLGSDEASKSIQNTLEDIKNKPDIFYLKQMLNSLNLLSKNTKGVAKSYAMYGTETKYHIRANAPLSSVFGGKTSVDTIDSGLVFDKVALKDLEHNLNGEAYSTIKKTISGGWFKSDKERIWTEKHATDPRLLNAFKQTLTSLKQGLNTSLDELGLKLNGNLQVDLGKISLKGKSADEVNELLNNVFSAQADRLAKESTQKISLSFNGYRPNIKVTNLLEPFTRIGEGAYETLTRLTGGIKEARHYAHLLNVPLADFNAIANKTADNLSSQIILSSIKALPNIANILKDTDVSAKELVQTYTELNALSYKFISLNKQRTALDEQLLGFAGGADNLNKLISSFEKNFLSSAEQHTARVKELSDSFANLGLGVPKSKEALKLLIQNQKLETTSDKARLINLLKLSNSYKDLNELEQKISKEKQENARKELNKIGVLNNSLDSLTSKAYADKRALWDAIKSYKSGNENAANTIKNLSSSLSADYRLKEALQKELKSVIESTKTKDTQKDSLQELRSLGGQTARLITITTQIAESMES